MHIHSMKRWLSGVMLGLAVLLLLGFGAAALAQEAPQENADPGMDVATPEEATDTFTFVSEEEPAEPLEATEPEISDAASSEPVVEETPEENTTTENVVEEGGSDTQSVAEEMSALVSEALPAPELSTDKDDYHPGETATIFGKFFAPLKSFVIKVFGSDEQNQNYTETEDEVTTDEEGSFSFSYLLDSLYRPFYEVVVSTLEGEKVAETWFRDAAVADYDQCSNDDGDGYATGDTGCRFINGAINGNNSSYLEGDATLQRLVLDGFAPGSSHTVTLQYGTTKGGHHAYDFLTTWDHSEDWATLADRCDGLGGCTTAFESTFPIPNDLNQSGQFQGTVGSREFVMRGGTLTGATTPSLSGSYASDSETSITVSFTTSATGTPMCQSSNGPKGTTIVSCGVILWFGAHIAKTSDWQPFNGTTGAGSIQGSPYHVAVTQLDGGSIGNRDNQMQADAIEVTSSITIIKDAQPNNAQDFAFTTTGTGLSSFSLDDDADNTLSNTKTFSGLSAGSYTVTEGLTSGWSLTNLSCVDPTSNTTVNVGTRQASINLAAGETVTCTYTNTLQTGTITIVKETVGGNDSFDFEGGLNDFTLTTVGNTDSETFNNVVAGTYDVTELIPEGWELTALSCDDANSSEDLGTETATINLEAGEHVTCTFENSKLPTLTINKIVTNDNGGTATAANFQGKIDGNNVPWGVAQTLAVGAHTASETTLSTYTASPWSGDCADNGSVTLTYGDAKSCTVTNDDKPATLIVKKVVINDNGGTAEADDFEFVVNDGTATDFESDGQNDLTVDAGVYTVTEPSAAGYTTSYDNCSNLDIPNGGTATCTITNTDNAPVLHLRKIVTNNNGGSATVADFTLTANGTDSNDISGTSPVDSEESLKADTFALSETNVAGYTASDWVCVGGTQNGANITLELGEEATCTITNDDQQAYITVTKVVNNNYGGEAEPNDFSLTLEDNPVSSGVAVPVNPGTYTAAETLVTGYAFAGFSGDCDGNGDITVALGESKTCTLTNNDLPGKISGYKFEDVNGNGNWDDGEGALSDWTINLDGDADDTDVTDVNGYYEFSDLSKGSYTVTETQQEGWQQTTPNPELILLGNGDEAEDVNFGNFKLVSISGSKYNDDEGDGAITDDAKLPGWTIRLYEVDGDVWNLVDETVTDGSGNYTFTGLFKGSYKVCEVLEEGWIQTFASVEADNESPSAQEEGQWCVTRNVTTSGSDPAAANFGNYEVQDLTVEKDADTSFTRTFEWTIDKSVTPETLNMFNGDSADVEYTVAVEKSAPVDSAWAVTGTITITNPNPASTGLDVEVAVEDSMTGDIIGDVVCPSDVVAAGDSLVCTYSADLPNGEDRVNTVTVTTESVVGGAENTADVDFGEPTTVVNNDITVNDTNGSSWDFSASGEVTYDETFSCSTDKGAHDNTVTIVETGVTDTATVTVNCYDIEIEKNANTTYTRTFNWDIEKTVDDEAIDLFEGDSQVANYEVTVTKGEPVDSDFAVSGTITITNNAPIDATIASITDTLPDAVDMEVVCLGTAPYTVEADGGTLVCTYSADLPDAEDRLNTATAALQNTPEGTTDYSATADVTFGDPNVVINDEVEVTDTMVEEALGTITASDVFKYTHEFFCGEDGGSHPNTALVMGENDEVLDSDDAEVHVNCYDLTVTKDAEPSFTRTWTWEVTKTSATTELTLAPEQIYPVEYTVTVDASSVDSDHAVSGTITIENPAPIDATLASVVDVMGDIHAAVDCPSMTVPANDTLVCTYTADLPNADTRTNTATVTLENDTEYSGDAEVNFESATMTEIDEEADLTDSLYGNLGTLNANTDTLPQEFTYSMDIGPYPVEECGEEFVVDNTATATTNDTGAQVSEDHDVAVELACVCSLTQGFWKTHNADFWGGAPAYEGWENLGDIDGDLVAELQDETFYKSGKTWFEIFWTAPKGNVYYNMAHQYMAAKLNVLNGAYGATINANLSAAETLLKTYTPSQIAALKGKNATVVSKQFNDLAGKFGAFNEGTTNPAGHCSEIPVN